MAKTKRSRILWAILIAIRIFSFSFPTYAKYAGGTGAPNDPYQIATAEDLMLLGESPEDYKHFILTADIDLDPNLLGRRVFDRAVIAPDTNDVKSGFHGSPFTGVFDGSGYKISNLTYDSNGVDYIGLFGYVNNPNTEINDLALIDHHIEAGTGDYIGMLVGSLADGTITGCSVEGGSVSAREYVGGLVGGNYDNVTQSYNTGRVTGNRSVGGLVGHNWPGSIATSYSRGAVTGNEDVGGLVGHNVGSIVSSYSSGPVTGDKHAGGLVGDNKEMVVTGNTTSSFWDIETSGQTESAGGEGKTTAEMQDVNTYVNAGWDFVDETFNGTCDYWQISPDG